MDDQQTPIPGMGHSVPCSKLESLLAVLKGNGTKGWMTLREDAESDHRKRIGKLEIGQARIGVLGGIVSGVIVAAVTKLL